ncbi:hypothetical protein WJX72_008850 [[Myrmecia] bisecta]|uniref:Protein DETOXIFICATION n=1 Tax=[Myrmecia] bisecta TaxID=41462 RepID=A0AAW1PHV7_9CHLO
MGSLGPSDAYTPHAYSRTAADPLDDLPTTSYTAGQDDSAAAMIPARSELDADLESATLIDSAQRQHAFEVSQAQGQPEVGGKSVLRQEVVQLAYLAAPATVQSVAQYCMVITTLLVVGRFAGTREMAAAAVANTYFNLMWALLMGIASGFDTLASQAYGARDRALVVSWGIVAALVLCIVCVPIGVSLWFGDKLALYVFRQPDDIAIMVAHFCRWLIPGMFPFVVGLVIIKGFQAQNMMWEPAWLTVAAAVINIAAVVTCMTIWQAGWAAAFAITLTRYIQLAYMIAYVYYSRHTCMSLERVQRTRPTAEADAGDDEEFEAVPLNSDSASSLSVLSLGKHGNARRDKLDVVVTAEPWSLQELVVVALSPSRVWQYCRLAIPGGCMMAVESGAWEVMGAMAGMLGTAELDASTALLSVAAFLYFTFPFGLATASTIRVGNLLGAGQAQRARLSAWLTVSCGAAGGAISGLICLALRHRIGRAFVDDEQVVGLVATIAPITAAFFALDGIAATAGGVLRGMGRQALLLAYNIGGFWFVGVPLGAVFTFVLGWRLPGLWLGTAVGCLIVAALGLVTLLRVDWEQGAVNSQASMRNQEHDAHQEAVAEEPNQLAYAADSVPV